MGHPVFRTPRPTSTLLRALGLILLLGTGCSSGPGPEPAPDPSVELFGFVGVSCGGGYADEVAGFTNVATACAPDPSLAALVVEQLDRLKRHDLKALLNVEGVFFEPDPGGALSPSGEVRLVLRADYTSRWNDLLDATGLQGRAADLAAVFPADEPTWRGIVPEDLTAAYEAVRFSLPTTPLLLVEAYPVLDALVVPEAADWVVFDRYGVLDPLTDAAYRADLQTLKARRSRPDQRVVIVMETQWLPAYAGFGVPPARMAGVAESYYALALQDPDVIGVVGYLWAGGADDPGQLGARDLPASVRAVYRRIGREIVGP